MHYVTRMGPICVMAAKWRRGVEGVVAPPRARSVLDGQPSRLRHAVGTGVARLDRQCRVRPPKEKKMPWRAVWHSLTTR